MDERNGMEREMRRKDDAKMKRKESSGVAYVSNDDSFFGFPRESRVINYPNLRELRETGLQNYDDIAGMDYQVDGDVAKMNRYKSNYRW